MVSQFLSSDLSYALAMTIIHSVWQIGVIALVLILVLRFLTRSPATHRYFVSSAALACSVIAAVTTFSIYYIDASNSIFLTSTSALEDALSYQVQTGSSVTANLASNYGYIIINVWIAGSILFLLRCSGAYLYLLHLIRKAVPCEGRLHRSMDILKTRFGIHRNISIRESLHITSPMVMGFIRPVVLFPVGLVNNLTAEEVEAILAHELAHIIRHDFVVNFLQSLAEILFYYHPGVWYISSRMRLERENCCDDLAIQMTGNSVSYARTLVKLQDLRHQAFSPALAFSGKHGHFSQRIFRILNLPVNTNNMKQKILVLAMVFTAAFAFARTMDSPVSEQESDACALSELPMVEACPAADEEKATSRDTIPEKETIHIIKKSDDEKVVVEMEDGEIRRFTINGRELSPEEYEKHEDILVKIHPDGDRDVITVIPDDEKSNSYFIRKHGHKDKVHPEAGPHFKRSMEALEEAQKQLLLLKENELADFWMHHEDGPVLAMELENELKKMKGKLRMDMDSIMHLVEPFVADDHIIFAEPHLFMFDNGQGFDMKGNLVPGDHEMEFFVHRNETAADLLTRHLLKDRLVEPDEKYKLELTGKHMKINGEKQPTNIWKKYKTIYEEKTGMELTKKSKIEVEIKATNNQHKSIFRKKI